MYIAEKQVDFNSRLTFVNEIIHIHGQIYCLNEVYTKNGFTFFSAFLPSHLMETSFRARLSFFYNKKNETNWTSFTENISN